MKHSTIAQSVLRGRGSLRAILRRSGFSLLEVVIVVALLAITGAVVVPSIARANARSRAVRVFDEMQLIALGIDRARQAAGVFPGFVSQITEKPIVNDPTNCVGKGKNPTWTTTQTNNWHSNKNLFGPFHRRRLSRRASSTGFVVANGWGTVNDSIGLVSALLFFIRISNVTAMDVAELDALVDAADGATAGTVRWTGQADGYVTVEYRIQSGLTDC